ncbi:methyltransferase [Legionella lansingensis]|uniref:Methyltransferase n=1 Tax=Legionella lansingensis TaxID=45067 RepID=A0A0W0VXP3_9GAMM|nr:class I SAM-dependent methyltransferase [Legionella lansingensis]KTD24976.1 methyltransferase [Legionella lansingensis]SNV48255.1 methyltransferase [Legionella lansingensis]
MPTQEWPAHDYAIGSYIQANIANSYLKYLEIKQTDHVLDIGCGNGTFSRKILDKIPQGQFLGIDASENMLALARQEIADYPNAKLQQTDVLVMSFKNRFDYIVSFWCLQWCAFAIEKAFLNIHRALKTTGKVLALFPSGDDPFITSYYRVQASGQFPCLNDFKPPVDYRDFQNLEEKILALPFKHIKFERLKHQILLPSLDIFRKFVKGIAFFQGQIPSKYINSINEALVNTYDQECQEKFSGEYWFTLSIYLMRGEK